jgi:ribosomal protein L11 methyltransferase
VDALVELAPAIAERVAPGGHLVTSGVLRSQQARVRAAYAPPLWRLRSAKRRGAWVTSVFQRHDDATARRAGAAARRGSVRAKA